MTKREFRRLLDKAIIGTLSPEESRILEKFQENCKTSSRSETFGNTSKSEIKESLWTAIEHRIHKSSRVARRLTLAASVAALVVISIGSGVFYFRGHEDNLQVLPTDAITLELEDGSIQILNDQGNTNLLNVSGTVVGTQDKTTIKYNEAQVKVRELVYNTLTIPYGKKFEIVLSDGTIAHLNAGSSLKYPVQFLENKSREVFIDGEVFLEVAKDPKNAFVVKAENLNIKVYGTKFNVQAYEEDTFTDVVLVEGSVGLYDGDKSKEEDITMLKPGYRASYNKESELIENDKVITSLYTSWMDGELVFRNMKFRNILKKMERYYDVSIVNENDDLSEVVFNASFGANPAIEDVLKELKIIYGIDFQIQNKTIRIL